MSWNSHYNARRPFTPKRKKARDWGIPALITIFGVLIVAGIILTTFLYNNTRTVETCKINGTDTTVSFSSDKHGTTSHTKRYVYTADCGTFVVKDNFFLGKFNSADTYGQLQKGKTYKLEVIGWRNGFLSQFPNILSATPAS